MRVSGAALLAQLRAAGCAPPATPAVVIGIDDWGRACGHCYGTIVVDLETHRPIELLTERNAATVVRWLKKQHAVKVIACDRAGAHANAARTAAPDAQQVADGWYLLANLGDAIKRLLLRYTGKLKKVAWQASEVLQLKAVRPKRPPSRPMLLRPSRP